MKSDELYNKLKKEVDETEYKINNVKIYNHKNRYLRNIIKAGIKLERIMPFVLAVSVTLPISKGIEHTPFVIDNHEQTLKMQIVDSSNGVHREKITHMQTAERKIEYSTGWKKNDMGLYERKYSSYMVNPNMNLKDLNTLFSMNKNQLDDYLMLTSEETIVKEKLEEYDSFYNEDVVIVTNIADSNIKENEKQSLFENMSETTIYILALLLTSKGFESLRKILVQDVVKNNLKVLESKYKYIDKEEVEKLKEIIKIKKENLQLIKGGDSKWEKKNFHL